MPTTSESLYEQLHPLTFVAKQRVVENFSGDTLNERWTTTVNTGTPTYAMADTVDGGFIVTAGSVLNANTSVGWGTGYATNGKRMFAHDGSVFIDVFKLNTAKSTHKVTIHGFGEQQRGDLGVNNISAFFTGSTFSAFFQTKTTNGVSGTTQTATTIAYDQIFHTYKNELNGSNSVFDIDGIAAVTTTIYCIIYSDSSRTC